MPVPTFHDQERTYVQESSNGMPPPIREYQFTVPCLEYLLEHLTDWDSLSPRATASEILDSLGLQTGRWAHVTLRSLLYNLLGLVDYHHYVSH